MKILSHPLKAGEYIIYVVDHVNRPIVAKLTNKRDDISLIVTNLKQEYDITSANYVDDFTLNSNKPRWKIKSV